MVWRERENQIARENQTDRQTEEKVKEREREICEGGGGERGRRHLLKQHLMPH